MCARILLPVTDEELAAFLEISGLPEIKPRYNIAPGQDVLVVRRGAQGERSAAFLRWGLGGRKLINARIETAARREPFRKPEVMINAKTAVNGFVVAEILDRRDRVLPGFSRQDCVPFTGDSVRHVLKWKTAQFAASQRADDWKIRFWIKNAELFSYLPGGLDPNQRDLARFPL